MASKKKTNKLDNSHFDRGMLKNKEMKMKRNLFFTTSARRKLKKDIMKDE